MNSIFRFKRKLTLDEKDLFEYLEKNCNGRARAMKKKDLCKAMNWEKRKIELVIEGLRGAGAPVFSGYKIPFGIFLGQNIDEAREFIKSVDHHIRSMAIGKNAATKFFKENMDPKNLDQLSFLDKMGVE